MSQTGSWPERRVALVQNAGAYVGPALCRALARSGHDLVVTGPRPGLIDELEAEGTAVELVDGLATAGAGSLSSPEGWATLVDSALRRFGRLDAAALSPPAGSPAGVHRGPFLDATITDLSGMY